MRGVIMEQDPTAAAVVRPSSMPTLFIEELADSSHSGVMNIIIEVPIENSFIYAQRSSLPRRSSCSRHRRRVWHPRKVVLVRKE